MSSASSEQESEPASSTSAPPSEGAPNPPKVVIAKEPLTEFIVGDRIVRDMLPTRPIPRCLNPNFVECDVKQLPVVWFGAPYEEDKVIPFAIANGFGVKRSQGDMYSASLTLVNLIEQFYKRFGIYLRMQEVWGLKDNLVFAFYSNRDMRKLTKRQLRVVLRTIEAMGFDDEDVLWWLDRDEEV
ncbi:hypothetical protein L227DRAFT_534420 [Lentinus tigrinus ALCF2SS1-6]|uniref:Uncharacterized protein n=1 Tax=Lentinus tigrinus ALCF2SS1-6 TaxID=1328759 RepID=A0A5C2RW74_9APHY|nr:hypothetical protein L227DRAFT_534420 [Lentinus tigrinus ALCF2SS1-6]